MERFKLADGWIDFNPVTGIEMICGNDAHKLFFTIQKTYREMAKKPSKIAYELLVLKELQKEIG